MCQHLTRVMGSQCAYSIWNYVVFRYSHMNVGELMETGSSGGGEKEMMSVTLWQLYLVGECPRVGVTQAVNVSVGVKSHEPLT